MKIATVGKGGAGKTTIAGTLSRVLARKQGEVLAIDGDPNPNLALTLGMKRSEADAITYIPSTVMKLVDGESGQRDLVMNMEKDALMADYAATAPDNVHLIVMGQPAHGTAGMG